MLKITEYIVVNHGRKLDIELPLELELAPDINASLSGDGEKLQLMIRRSVDAGELECVQQPDSYRPLPNGGREPIFCIRLKDDHSPEGVLAHDLISGISFLTDTPLSLSSRLDIHGDKFEPESKSDREILKKFGTNRQCVTLSGQVRIRSITGEVTAEFLTALMPRRVGLRIYADALKSTFVVAQFRELWRVLESAFTLKGNDLVDILAEYPPVQELGFDHQEIQSLLRLRNRASHAYSRKGIEELMKVEPECAVLLPRLKNLVERVISTKKSWGYPTKGVEIVLPLSGYVEKNTGISIIHRKV